MSALAGLWNFTGRPGSERDCARMLEAQAIYGPDSGSLWSGDQIALGYRQSINLPEDRSDRQPLAGGGGRFVLAADLRLDNRDDLIRALRAPAGLPDSALLLAAWENWQADCFDHLVGDYAFALWDLAECKLILARDPFGCRALHFHRGRDFFAFASMPKGLHVLPDIPRAPDEARTTEIFALVPEFGSRSFFKDIERVEPGQMLTVTPGGISGRRHWNPKRSVIRLASDGEYAEALRAHLDEAVRARLRGAGDIVGSHLSGGLDSSAVAATAARLMAPQGGKVAAFTSVPRAGFDGPDMQGRFGDEEPLAAATASLYPNMEQILIRTGGQSLMDNLDRNFFLFERPLINICNQVWYDALNESARQRKIGVMLSAFNGNITFSYDGMTLLPESMMRGDVRTWWRAACALVRRRNAGWIKVAGLTLNPVLPKAAWALAQRLRGRRKMSEYTVVNSETVRARGLTKLAHRQGMDFTGRPRSDGFALRLWAMGRSDLGNYYKGWLGGWGIDVRDVSADRRLVEFCLNLPMEQFLADGVPRALARRAFADRLPRAVLEEKRRGLQTADWHESMAAARTQIREEIDRLERNEAASAMLDIPRIRALVENWPQAGWHEEETYAVYRLALLRGLSGGDFLRRASGGN